MLRWEAYKNLWIQGTNLRHRGDTCYEYRILQSEYPQGSYEVHVMNRLKPPMIEEMRLIGSEIYDLEEAKACAEKHYEEKK